MDIETVGHAGLLLRDDGGRPVLFTDPWVRGSCYWRSWWLQNYPDEQLLEELRSVPYCIITHEHPDHFHTASIRALGRRTRYLSPDFQHGHVVPYLSSQGLDAKVLTPFAWQSVHPQVQVLSIPLFNDDSVLLINTPSAVIVNLNDSKPRATQLRQLAQRLDVIAGGKRRVLLCSYSPASIVNSFLRGKTRVSLREKASYVRAVSEHCRALGAHDFLPFASQVIFKRRDSAWANAFKVTIDDLRAHWTAPRTRLLPPYTRLSLVDGAYSFVPQERYRHEDGSIAPKVAAQEALDAAAALTDDDVERLRGKLGHYRWLLALLFPRGIGFDGAEPLHYNPWTGTVERGRSGGDFELHIPGQALKEAVEYGHFGDLGTTMFTVVQLNGRIHPRRVYAFFLLITLHDYGHTDTFRNWIGWVRRSLRIHRWRVPDLSDVEPVRG